MSRKKQNLEYIKPNDPRFLKKIKDQIGYKEGPTLEDKFNNSTDQSSNAESLAATERDDELPQIVQLKEGDLSQEELERIKSADSAALDKKMIEEGRITFTKPLKRKSDCAENELPTIKRKVDVKATNDSRLLSFAKDEVSSDSD